MTPFLNRKSRALVYIDHRLDGGPIVQLSGQAESWVAVDRAHARRIARAIGGNDCIIFESFERRRKCFERRRK